MPPQLSVDVFVVGAGPAGCAAAIRAASRGLRVALVEKRQFPRDVPGEALHPDVEYLLEELGVAKAVSKAGFIRFPGWMLVRGDVRTFIGFAESGLRFGYQAWRADLDSLLLSRARRAGVKVLEHAGRTIVRRPGDRVVGVRVGDVEVSCRYLIDASGSNRWLSRTIGLGTEQLSPPLVAQYGYLQGDADFGIIPEFHEHPGGWTWLARVRADCCQVVRLSVTDGIRVTPLPEPFNGVTRLRGADVTWRMASEAAGPGYFLIGDAAATLDPSASSGVARALAAGITAADLITDVAERRASEADAATAYRQWLGETIAAQALQLAGRYAELEQPPAWIDALPERLEAFAGSTKSLESPSAAT